MKKLLPLFVLLGLMAYAPRAANADFLIGGPATGSDPAGATSHNNGNLDIVHPTEVVPGFFLPKPNVWDYSGSRTITGPYEDGLSSESFAGPAPTPVTADGNLNPPNPPVGPDGGNCGGPDCGVFFKPFGGDALGANTNGFANVHLSQTFPVSPGGNFYTLTGWGGAEANMLGNAVWSINYLNGGGGLIGSTSLDITAAIHTPNGQPFNYKKFSLSGSAPFGTVFVQADVAMLNGTSNPAGGGQAYVVDDFTFTRVPEPATLALVGLGVLGMLGVRRRR